MTRTLFISNQEIHKLGPKQLLKNMITLGESLLKVNLIMLACSYIVFIGELLKKVKKIILSMKAGTDKEI